MKRHKHWLTHLRLESNTSGLLPSHEEDTSAVHFHFHGVFLLLSLLFTITLGHGRSSPSSAALDTLQKQLGYEFISRDLLNRAITHASYSLDNNRALSVLGLDAMRAAVAVQAIGARLDVSSKSLSQRIEAATGGKPCAAGGRGLGLDKVVKVAGRTNASADSVVCGTHRAVFGAVAIDAGSVDDAGGVFWKVVGEGGRSVFDL